MAEAAMANAARIVLQWPTAEREGATLEVDGQSRELAADLAGVDAEQIAITVAPGKHTVRIVRPGFDDFRTELADLRGEERLTVTWVASAHVRPATGAAATAAEFRRRKYEPFEEYQKWAAEADVAKQSELLRFLLAKLESEAGTLPGQSAAMSCLRNTTWR